jgi:hypothetical protein
MNTEDQHNWLANVDWSNGYPKSFLYQVSSFTILSLIFDVRPTMEKISPAEVGIEAIKMSRT